MLETPINRHYVRTGSWSVKAKVKKEETHKWIDALVQDIAAGGLLFLTDMACEKGDLLRFDLNIDPMAPGIPHNIKVKAKGEVTGDRGEKDGKRAFSVKFTEISTSDRIRIDELIRMTNYTSKLNAGLDIIDL